MKVLITGGAGYIGSHTLLALARIKKCQQIVIFDNLENGNHQAVEIVKKKTRANVKLVVGDLRSKADIKKLFTQERFDVVIHFAALIEVGISMERPGDFFDNNICGSINLIRQMQQSNVRKIVFSSSAAVYGSAKNPEVTEETPVKPENWYGYTKLVVEELLHALAGPNVKPEEKINSISLRYFNAAGADPDLLIGQDYHQPTHLITLAVQTALRQRQELIINGNDYPTPDGTCIRDYVHVADLAQAHLAALGYLQNFTGQEIINIGTGKGSSNLEVVKTLEKIHGQFNYRFGPRRPGDPVAYYANTDKAKRLLNWQVKYKLEDIVRHAYQWAKKYPHGYKDIT